ncbi:negative elongation factor C/D isoform X2 [Heterodontus francisci]|uniref:negative elongation factor C/D isoform X2 n=1 Tax=Heterodontus francisci TaxID=7792 RepID=UPI00355B7091
MSMSGLGESSGRSGVCAGTGGGVRGKGMSEEYFGSAADWEDQDGSMHDEDDGDGEDDAEVQQECLQKFSSRDYIMEPPIFNTLKRYFQAGGSPEHVIQMLSENYTAVAQTVNLLAEWLIQTGVEPSHVQETVENHLKNLLIKHFDPRKADSIFTEEGETPAWLEQMIAHVTWRDLFYKLAEAHPDCLMLNFTVKLISDAGYQGEITSVSTACQQLEVFSRVLRTSLATLVDGGEEHLEKNLPEFAKMVCHGEHTYLYAQSIMSVLAQEEQGGAAVRRIAQEVQRYAHENAEDTVPWARVIFHHLIHGHWSSSITPSVGTGHLPLTHPWIRVPAFLDLFMQSLFKPGSKINPEHKHKYIYILAYAASVVESWKKNKRFNINKDELKSTSKAIETVHNLCCNENKGASELVAELGTLYQCIRFPVVAMGVLKWVDWTVSEPSYFQLQTDHTPVHLALLDEISTCHQLLHPQVLQLLVKLFETEHSQLDVMEQLELKKTLLDRMVHLLSRGYVLPVVSYIRKCLEKLDTDISLIRYFVTEVLDVIAPPYTSDFVHLFLPILENDSIVGTIKTEGECDAVAEFIAHCKSNFIMMN